ncbi:hypothetical protein ACHAXS_013556 [Conticribra weissflogii]
MDANCTMTLQHGGSTCPLLNGDEFQNSASAPTAQGESNDNCDRKSRPISTMTLILSPIAVLLPTMFICAALLPPPPSSRQNMPHTDLVAPTLLSIFQSIGEQGNGGRTKLVHVLKNDLYEELKFGIFHWGQEEQTNILQSSRRTAVNNFSLQSNRDELRFGDPVTLTWSDEITKPDSKDVSRGHYVDGSPIKDDDIIALYCPAEESDPKKFRDSATIAQARATHSRHQTLLSDDTHDILMNNIWMIPSFPIVREDSCEFRLYAHEKRFTSEEEPSNSKLRWFSPKEQTMKEEHHYTLLATTGPISLTDSKKVPTGIHISLTGDPTEMNIQFTTGDSGKPVVEIAKSDVMVKEIVSSDIYNPMSLNEGVEWIKVEGESTTYTASDMCQEPATSTEPGCFISPGQLHTVKVTGLDPNTDYLYRVGVATGQGIKWSDYFAFRSSLPPGPTAEPLTFLAFGDQGCEDWNNITSGAPNVTKLITHMIDHENITINSIHHLGDLSYAMGAAHIWDEWFNMIQPYASRVPLMVGVGNHEYDHTAGGGGGKDPSGSMTEYGFEPAWGNFGDDSFGECGVPVSKRFASPSNGNGVFWYSYEQSLVHTIMLSSEHNMTAGSSQYIWFENDLRNVDRSRTPWIVVEMHRPLYNSEKYWNQDIVGIAMRNEIEELLLAYHVDLVLAGHYHSYLRTCDGLYRGKCNSSGPMHITIGTGGANLDDGILIPNKWTEYFDESHHGVGRITVANATYLHWEYVVVGGDVLDEVWVNRNRSLN